MGGASPPSARSSDPMQAKGAPPPLPPPLARQLRWRRPRMKRAVVSSSVSTKPRTHFLTLLRWRQMMTSSSIGERPRRGQLGVAHYLPTVHTPPRSLPRLPPYVRQRGCSPFVARVMQAAREVQCVAGSARQHGWAGARRGSGGGERAAKLAVSSSSGGGGSRSSSIRPCCTVLGQCKASVATCVPVSRANHLPRFRAPTEVLRVPQLPEHYPLSLSLSLSSLSLSPLSVSL